MKILSAGKLMRCSFFAVLWFYAALPLAAQDLKIDRPPPPAPAVDDGLPAGWEKVGENLVRAEYRVPPDFLRRFADNDAAVDVRAARSAKEVLESVGIPFGEGATAKYDRFKSRVTVVNTRQNMVLVDTFLAWGEPAARKLIAVRTEIYELTQLQVLQLLESAALAPGDRPENRNTRRGMSGTLFS